MLDKNLFCKCYNFICKCYNYHFVIIIDIAIIAMSRVFKKTLAFAERSEIMTFADNL